MGSRIRFILTDGGSRYVPLHHQLLAIHTHINLVGLARGFTRKIFRTEITPFGQRKQNNRTKKNGRRRRQKKTRKKMTHSRVTLHIDTSVSRNYIPFDDCLFIFVRRSTECVWSPRRKYNVHIPNSNKLRRHTHSIGCTSRACKREGIENEKRNRKKKRQFISANR